MIEPERGGLAQPNKRPPRKSGRNCKPTRKPLFISQARIVESHTMHDENDRTGVKPNIHPAPALAAEPSHGLRAACIREIFPDIACDVLGKAE